MLLYYSYNSVALSFFSDKEQISGFEPELGEVPTDAQLSV